MASCKAASVGTAPQEIAAPAAPAAPGVASAPEKATGGPPVIETHVSPEFGAAFDETRECRGVEVLANGQKAKPDFKVNMVFAHADTPEMEEVWTYTIFDARRDPNGSFLAIGNETSPQSAMRGMCNLVVENFKP